ncbi:Neurexin-1a-alpha [Eufriesea mexicana]|uniref:Neurexin-1a-alpha n=1 Tax=Eufriesea mexicana TaxID=516756 RepID=A0A310SLA4_9HYME|nr:Neurexin-1a-alpha [Eufriesea mexicana]
MRPVSGASLPQFREQCASKGSGGAIEGESTESSARNEGIEGGFFSLGETGRDLELRSSEQDLFAFEVFEGHMYLHIDLGSGPVKVKSSKQRVDDSTWHEVELQRIEREGRVTVDGSIVEFRTPGDSTQLDLDGLLYIGGVGAPFAPLTVPPVLWTGALRQGYVGCMRDLVINRQQIDIAGYAQQQDSGSNRHCPRNFVPLDNFAGAVRPACHSQPPHCPSQPCMHGSYCIEGWNRFHCDCTRTPFTGPTCGKDASTLHLNGTQQMTALMPEDSKTQTEEIAIRFKTSRPRGLLLSTSLENSPDRLQIYLEEGKAKMLIHIGDKEKVQVLWWKVLVWEDARHCLHSYNIALESGNNSSMCLVDSFCAKNLEELSKYQKEDKIPKINKNKRQSCDKEIGLNTSIANEKDVTLIAGQGLNDDMWHTLMFSRRAGSLKFQIDEIVVRILRRDGFNVCLVASCRRALACDTPRMSDADQPCHGVLNANARSISCNANSSQLSRSVLGADLLQVNGDKWIVPD